MTSDFALHSRSGAANFPEPPCLSRWGCGEHGGCEKYLISIYNRHWTNANTTWGLIRDSLNKTLSGNNRKSKQGARIYREIVTKLGLCPKQCHRRTLQMFPWRTTKLRVSGVGCHDGSKQGTHGCFGCCASQIRSLWHYIVCITYTHAHTHAHTHKHRHKHKHKHKHMST